MLLQGESLLLTAICYPCLLSPLLILILAPGQRKWTNLDFIFFPPKGLKSCSESIETVFLETLVVSPTLIDHMILLELIDLEYNVAFIKNRKFLVAQIVKSLPAMQETRVWSLGGEDPLKKEMAIHFSILTWRNPWNEEPGRLQSNGSHRAGLD